MTRRYDNFAATLTAARVEACWTQATAATMIGVPTSTYKAWEQGRVLPSLTLVQRLLDVYDDDAIERAYTTAKTDQLQRRKGAGQGGERDSADLDARP